MSSYISKSTWSWCPYSSPSFTTIRCFITILMILIKVFNSFGLWWLDQSNSEWNIFEKYIKLKTSFTDGKFYFSAFPFAFLVHSFVYSLSLSISVGFLCVYFPFGQVKNNKVHLLCVFVLWKIWFRIWQNVKNEQTNSRISTMTMTFDCHILKKQTKMKWW